MEGERMRLKILLTGASSFTGYWFARTLAGAGHDVLATLQRSAEAYEGLRAGRVREISSNCAAVYDCTFGSERFRQLIAGEGPWDVLCHHAADVSNYKSPDFDVAGALANNTRALPAVLEALREAGCRRVVLTGSVFEQDEGAGELEYGQRRAFSPYGLSKGLTAQVFQYYALRAGMRLGKFVIPNPFGPYEEPRFTAYLVRTWKAGEIATVKTPRYVRDNIHVSLLAKAYVRFVEQLGDEPGLERCGPSQYVESQGAFAQRFAAEMGPRLGVDARLQLLQQTEFEEPRVRINTDVLNPVEYGWDEARAWDELGEYYRE